MEKQLIEQALKMLIEQNERGEILGLGLIIKYRDSTESLSLGKVPKFQLDPSDLQLLHH